MRNDYVIQSWQRLCTWCQLAPATHKLETHAPLCFECAVDCGLTDPPVGVGFDAVEAIDRVRAENPGANLSAYAMLAEAIRKE